VELTARAGEFELVVSASSAWNETAGQVTSCELLRRTITVKEGLGTNSILGGAGGAAVVVIGGLVIVVRKRHAHLQAILTMLLTEMGMLVFSICTALANLTTDGIVFGRLLRGKLKVSSELYTAAYATILCFGVVATALSLGYRIRNAYLLRAQLQQHAPQLSPKDEPLANSDARYQLQQHEWELVRTHRTKVMLSLSLMSATAQGANVACELALPAAANVRIQTTWLAIRRGLQICRCPR
jgi:Ca2+/Na+ antiporter